MDGEAKSEFLNVRETAAMLQIHENTVRNWAKSGVLRDARLPGAKFLRFHRFDVERLRDNRGTSPTSLQPERQIVGPELINASQLGVWANSVASRPVFPDLIRRLLAATPGIKAIEIRAGDGIDLGGWDGSAESDGTSFLPRGSLRFEFGVNKKFKAKAADDWSKRISAERQPTKFVFATPRRWSDAQRWVEDRRAEKKFADVRVLDGDTLEGWLLQTPAVHHWISEQLGRRPQKAVTSESWWERFSAATTPELPLPLFVAGRDEQALSLERLLREPPRAISVRSEWREDVLAFAHAVNIRATAEEDLEAAPLVFVDSPEVFARIAQERGRATLVPMFEKADVGLAISHGHHVILVIDDSLGSSSRPDVDLARLNRIAAADALQLAQVEFRDAQRFAAHARRNLQAFIRSISIDPRFARPAWAEPPLADQLARLLLLGAWTISDADMGLLGQLLDKSSDDIEALLHQVSGSDPVIRRTGAHWAVTSPREAFDVLGPTLSARPKLLDRWIATAYDVLSEPDPVLDLAEEERPYAGLHDVRRAFSTPLRRGTARGVALLGALGDSFPLPDGGSLAGSAASLVRQLLGAANADSTGRRWQELCDVLPLLAEGAPQEFLDALQIDLARPEPLVAKLFEEPDDGASPLGGFSLHTHLLWAIENLCWSAEHLPDGIRALARLAQIDPGGRTANRPAASLATVLCGWVNHTSASIEERVAAVQLVRDQAPEICWKLVLKLLPSQHDVSFPPHHPYARRWMPLTQGVPMSVWAAFTSSMVDIGLQLVTQRPSRIGKLVGLLGNVPPGDREKIMAELAGIASTDSKLSAESRLNLWESIRKTIAHHARFPEAQWSFPEDTLSELQAVAKKLEPTDDPKRLAYLFDWRPDVPGLPDEDYAAEAQHLERLRQDALIPLTEPRPAMEAIAEVACHAPQPSHLGFTLASFPAVTLADMLPWLRSNDAALNTAASSWVARRLQDDQAPIWLQACIRNADLTGPARELFLRSVPVARHFWTVIERRKDDSDFWWSNAYARFVAGDDLEDVVARLVAHHRPWAAVEILAPAAREKPEDHGRRHPVSSALIIQTLDAAISSEFRKGDVSSMTSYYVGQLLDALDDDNTNEQTMVRFEFAFFRLLEHTRQPKVLYTALANQPEFFVDLAKRVYRGKSETPREQDDHAAGLARQAWWILNGWTGFPGLTADGQIDSGVLVEWVKTARLLFSESDRADIGDELIGQTFAHASAGADDIWPPEPIRDLIEIVGSQELENGVRLGRFNSRGVTTRGAYEGGKQERDLAAKYGAWGQAVKTKAPRTARILRNLADDYDRDARREDIRADIDADAD